MKDKNKNRRQDPRNFGRIPNPLLWNPEVTPSAKCLYALLTDYCGTKTWCFPSVQSLAADLGVSQTSIRAWTRELVEAKVLKVERKGRTDTPFRAKPNIYTLLDLRPANPLTAPYVGVTEAPANSERVSAEFDNTAPTEEELALLAAFEAEIEAQNQETPNATP
jgi:DNA-binding transcriptional ArsR family regulator